MGKDKRGASGVEKKKLLEIGKKISTIPKNFGSRASIQNILNLGLKDNFFIKVQSKKDKRVQDIKIKDELLKYIEIWIKMHTGVFDPAITVEKEKAS